MFGSPSTAHLAARARRMVGRRRWRRLFTVSVVVLTAVVAAAQFRSAEVARRRWADTRVVVVARRDLAPGDVLAASAVDRRELVASAVAPAALSEVPEGSVVRYPVAAGEPLVAARLAPDGLTGIAALVPAGERAVALPVGPGGRPPLQVGDRVDVMAVVAPYDAVWPGPTEVPGDVDGPAAEVPGDVDGPATDSPDEADDPAADSPDEVDEPAADDDGVHELAGLESRPGSARWGSGAQGDPPERPAGAPVSASGVVPLVERALVVDVADEAVTVAVPSALAPAVAAAVTQGAVVLALTGA